MPKTMDIPKITTALSGRGMGCLIHYEPSLPSTHEWTKRAVQQGTRTGTLCITDHQTAGHGRLDRSWESASQKNLLISFVDDCPEPREKSYQLTLVAGIAFISALKALLPNAALGLKWPNDLILEGKKLGGLLSDVDLERGQLTMSLGLNVNAQPADWSPTLAKQATSLSLVTHHQWDRESVLTALLLKYTNFRGRFAQEGLAPFIPLWEEACVHRGKRLEVSLGSQTLTGVCRGLDHEGLLLIESNGQMHSIIAGDITILE